VIVMLSFWELEHPGILALQPVEGSTELLLGVFLLGLRAGTVTLVGPIGYYV